MKSLDLFRPKSINPYRLSYKLRDATLFESASKSTILFWRPFWNSNTSWMGAKYRLFSALKLTSWISSLFYHDHLKIFHFFCIDPMEIYVLSWNFDIFSLEFQLFLLYLPGIFSQQLLIFFLQKPDLCSTKNIGIWYTVCVALC